MFRPATTEDLPFITGLLREFYRKDGGIYKIPWDSESAMFTIAEVILRGVCIVGPSSAAGAIIKPFPWNYHVSLAHVVFWKFRQAREIAIFETLAENCRAAGATHIEVASLYPDNAIARWYSKHGLTACEQGHIRRL